MPFRKSKTTQNPDSRSQEHICSEDQLKELAHRFALNLRQNDWVLLEGPMGVGKSTFARAMLEALEIHQPAEGSPTFALAHEYSAPKIPRVVHIDFYRINSEEEIDEAGIPAYFWESDALVISEWASRWPEFYELLKTRNFEGRTLEISLEFDPEDPSKRKLHLPKI